MKKKNLLLALLSSSLILASCGDDKTDSKGGTENGTSQADDSNVTSGDPTGTSEPEISVDTRTNEQKVKELFALMAEGKTSTFEYEGYKTEYYGDDKGIWTTVPTNTDGYTDYGTAVIANYGIYNIEYDDDSDEMYLSSIITPNTALTIANVAFTTKDLGTAAASIAWAESSRTHTFSTTDTTFCATMMYMLGLNDYVGAYAGMKVSFNVNETGTALTNMALALTNGTSEGKALKDLTVEGMKISKVNETVNLDFEVLIANSQITARTAWSQYELTYFTTYIHASFTLPFPTGASYAINETVTESKAFVFMDYGCGNIANSYKNQIEAAGFTVNTDITAGNTGAFGYDKVLVAASGNNGPIKEYVMFTWINDSSSATMYPNGVFMIQAYVAQEELKITYSEMNTMLTAHTLSNGTAYWPSINLTNCTGASYQDLTEDANDYYYYDGYEFEFYGVIKLYFATEAEAITAANNINAKLGKEGYADNGYGTLVLDASEDPYGYSVEKVGASVEVAYDENGNYLGYIEIVVYHYSYEYSYY